MRLGTLLLGLGVLSLLVGAPPDGQDAKTSAPEKKVDAGDPLSLFAKAKDEDFMGQDGCAACHEDKVKNFRQSGHATFVSDPKLPLNKQGCEACHGPGSFHQSEENPQVISYSKNSPKEVAAACLRCHEKTMTASHWKRTGHAQADVACTSCHQIHTDSNLDAKHGSIADGVSPVFVAKAQPKKLLKGDEIALCGQCHKSEVVSFKLNSHHPVQEGRMVCSDCHDLHPNNASAKKATAFKDKCVTCHAEKAGPFVYEHDPSAGWTGDGCVECHKPHGSQNPKLLKAFSRGLCVQCHTDKGSSHYPGRTCWSAGCHVASHGSNTDSRFLHP
jgi:predicted CXXCH cytochrome family protein